MSFLFMFSVSADPRDGFPCDSPLIISLLSVPGFPMLIIGSGDQDVEEAGENDAEEFVNKPERTNGT